MNGVHQKLQWSNCHLQVPWISMQSRMQSLRDEDEEDSLMMKNYMIIAIKHMCMKRLGYPSADGQLNTM